MAGVCDYGGPVVAMIEQGNLDALLLATPTQSHAPLTRQGAAAGLHVFCEKPFTMEASDSRDLAALFREKGLVGQVGYHYRYVAAFQEVKPTVPFVVRLEGTNVAQGRLMLEQSGLNLATATDLTDAAKKVVAAAKK